ncbi:unnamed protein product [Bursaphelenchus okinawaensis]|uniref:Small ribosomal subunit protein mS26 n=1 Tax=Bursaphelenchus okinawaensis TaxID=465554 RepID=A0A811JXS4_9BILA|nr:unnamed protein product [Bursaphelenchus okinawaensis]CAG9086669.1 unnamed protein product [Bursaphelenchus okinawaensis]
MASTSGLCRNGGNTFNLIFTRSMRRQKPKQGKPPVLPPSKTVRYHVVHVPWQKPEYVEELLWRRHVYNNAMVSLIKVFKEEIKMKEEQGMGIEALKEQEQVELDELIAQNEERNRQAAEERKIRDLQRQAEVKQLILEEVEEKLDVEYQDAEMRTKEVLAMIDRSANFVTKENLEQRILDALEKPTVFDYCINLKGDKYYDPEPVKYQTGTPTRQKGRIYDRTLGFTQQMRSADVRGRKHDVKDGDVKDEDATVTDQESDVKSKDAVEKQKTKVEESS